jgi:hypothetical protein
MRIALAQVAAWWIVQLDAEGHARFSLFSADQDQ